MVTHFIFIADDYRRGKRISWQTTSDLTTFMDDIANVSDKLNAKKFISYATHTIDTERNSWDSVVAADPFFEDVSHYTDVVSFINDLELGLKVTANDIAELISEKVEQQTGQLVPEMALMKLVYYVYSEALTKYQIRLFDNNFVAFDHGPVDRDVWDRIKYSKNYEVEPVFTKNETSPVQAKLLASGKYQIIQKVIDDILSVPSTTSKYDLMRKTHQHGTPWDIAYKNGQNTRITDELIRQHHAVESL
ncbi:Panacea domain-containing protein [Lactiplantibacillus pentosus]|uniref:Panacea domain-containing protein n=1 Tax=Lactiplantibacillus pentosus TaxID=1589 RepID=UPI001330E97D|nr:type II toxin-antitoxin system antitoxin SocA domain-containing protein [Lactiplantibacillus pentosus]MBQ0836993.1 DUF4065 domain-containing protein [Lactiplantibacillus pentosus]MBU7465093.1 DUF4065 domain-containing protein [Lactiplantibacillus pentosus]MBU7490378.1 DUF4065 domain-containing protein [Lactiplantibacillus pentosus]MBU7494177.1 DUF4065 domain-containing protein [Lactiplantibacillus pentosus]MBU7520152.1 DUF4065 domain-containing protein [Lactiplantibacillus pentosus]